MMMALRDIIEGNGVEDQWAKERVQALFGKGKPLLPDPDEMEVNLGGVRLTVSGKGVALVLAPGLRPQRDGDEPI